MKIKDHIEMLLFCDGSYRPGYKSGYGLWVVADDRRFKSFGVARDYSCHTSMEAEAIALIKASIYLKQLFFKHRNKACRLTIYIDNLNLILLLNDKTYRNFFRKTRIWLYVSEILKNLKGYDYKIKHIVAHQTKFSPATYVHNWCDRMARKQLREQYKKGKHNDDRN